MKKKINPFSSALINIGLNIIRNTLVRELNVPGIESDIDLLLSPIKGTVKVLSDNDPNDKEQTEQVWLDFVRSNEFNASYKNRIMQAISLIEDETVRNFVQRIALPCLETISALYDANPNNVEQIRDTWIAFATNKENINSIVSFFVKDEEMANHISVIIDSIHDEIAAVIQGQ